MNKTIRAKWALLAMACACVVFSAVAEDEAEAKPAEGGEAVPEVAAAKPEKFFYPLLRCILIDGCEVQVLKPREKEWKAVEEKKFYPLGSTFRVNPLAKDGVRAEFAFGEKSRLVVTNSAEFATKEIEIGDAARTLVPRRGTLSLNLPRTLRDGMFSVAAPFFECCNLAGESMFTYAAEGDGDEVVIRCVTGSMALVGRHYKIERMGAANQIRIRTTGDDLFTSMRGESGDCKVQLDQGLTQEKNFETGEVKDVPKTLEFSLSPQCAIKIFRAKSKVGGRMVVSMMTFNPAGEMVNRCAFAENRANVNSGELVVAATVPEAEKDKAKSADEEAEAVESVDVKPEDGAEEKKEDENKEEASEDADKKKKSEDDI